jgi:NADH dehydrogenase
MLEKEAPHVVVIGAGFAGLAVVRGLARAHVRVTLVDRTNHHLFQPLLYQVATAALAAPDIAVPTRKLLWKQANATVCMANVTRIQTAKREVTLDGITVSYDYLVLAAGMTHTYFGNDAWARHAPGLKTIGEALDVRRRILRAFEAAELEPDPKEQKAWTTFVVIGAGPTGVELAGALAEIAGRTLARDFRHFDPRKTRVVLVERGPRVLPTFHEKLSARAHEELEELGIEVRTGTGVSEVGSHFVELGDERIETRTVLWAAGVKANPLASQLGVPMDRAGRVWVEEDLSVPDFPSVFVAGDLIARTQGGVQLPAVAPLAMQSGAHVAKNIRRVVEGKPRLPFNYVDKGAMATIGRHKAVAQIGRFRFAGIFAWWLWLFVHVMSLVDHKRKISVFFEWAWAYFTWQRRSRVILEIPSEMGTVPKRLEAHARRSVGPHSVRRVGAR